MHAQRTTQGRGKAQIKMIAMSCWALLELGPRNRLVHIHNDLARGKRPVPSKRGVNIRSEIPKYLPSGLLKKVADVLDLLGLHERGRIKKNVGDRHSY